MSESRWVSAIDGWKTTIAVIAVEVVGLLNVLGVDEIPAAGTTELIDETGGMLLMVVGLVFGVLRWFTDSKARVRAWFTKKD